jgi:hypothetical protein
MLGPMDLLANLVAALTGQTDAQPDWDDDGAEPCALGEGLECEGDRLSAAHPQAGRLPVVYPTLDLQAKAATAKYPDGRTKRTAFPRVKLEDRRVVIVLHQVGAERASSNSRWHLITAHRTIKPDGTRCLLHPLDVRLIEANRFDRAPWHGIGIEVGGNFEGIDGAGNWYAPERFGRGRASDAQIEATRQEIEAICEGVAMLGGRVAGVAPHRVSGRDSKGRPNRILCPGSRVWSQVGEWAGAELGLAIPGPTFALGGTVVPEAWHGPYWPRCQRFL